MIDFVIYNGQTFNARQVPLDYNNRAFRYGDAFFESIKCNGHYPLHFHLHYKRMVKAMLSLKMDIASFPDEEEWKGLIAKLLQKNKSFGASRVRIQVFRRGEGLYTAQTNKVSYLIESLPLNSVAYQLNSKGLLVDVYDDMKKQYSPLSFFKNSNALHYVLAAGYKNEKAIDDCLLVNDQNKIIEAGSSNLFWLKDGVIFTPSVFTSCIDGVMRAVILGILEKHNVFQLIETRGATSQELLQADEVFITNAIQGIQWVVGFKEKRYYCQMSKKLVELLNTETFGA
ncbi:branched-chain amino acid aminotransferase [Saccharicrinis carchari]|uniref:branched-chain-amino-acid transaminase n=1 Tax=Saccharicrinis carchari TaxID=1168039 RepID=A0A521CM58_SACCC|nr:aminotransferase class IV [Saccharicrinis carchari]SMO59770.1 branched-chain amino acid aminotransferase [Saccharicrinis carchari]